MKHSHRGLVGFLAVLAGLTLALPGWGQYREYLISGKVVDTQKNPMVGVEITLRDVATSRSYNLKTKKDGDSISVLVFVRRFSRLECQPTISMVKVRL